MPDKEFDDLFRNKFNDAEITPSVNLWANIEQQLAPKRKRTIPIYWMAAATIAIAFTAMLAFQKEEKIRLHVEDTTANVATPLTTGAMAIAEDHSTDNSVADRIAVKANVTTARVNSVQQVNNTQNTIADNELKNNQLALQPNSTNDRLLIKQADPRPIDVLPTKETTVENPIVIAQVEPQQKVESNLISETESTVERKGIRNVGDLVNYVVDKVDKRDKKFLKFNTDDDDNSSLIGINIGFVKLNSRKHK